MLACRRNLASEPNALAPARALLGGGGQKSLVRSRSSAALEKIVIIDPLEKRCPSSTHSEASQEKSVRSADDILSLRPCLTLQRAASSNGFEPHQPLGSFPDDSAHWAGSRRHDAPFGSSSGAAQGGMQVHSSNDSRCEGLASMNGEQGGSNGHASKGLNGQARVGFQEETQGSGVSEEDVQEQPSLYLDLRPFMDRAPTTVRYASIHS